VARDPVVAIALLTRREVELLGPTFTRLWPVDDTPSFADLLDAIDEADRELSQSQSARDRE